MRKQKTSKNKEKFKGKKSSFIWALPFWGFALFSFVKSGMLSDLNLFNNNLFVIYFGLSFLIVLLVLLGISFFTDFILGNFANYFNGRWKGKEKALSFVFFIIKFIIMGISVVFLMLAMIFPLALSSL
jgi:hypothetical protein